MKQVILTIVAFAAVALALPAPAPTLVVGMGKREPAGEKSAPVTLEARANRSPKASTARRRPNRPRPPPTQAATRHTRRRTSLLIKSSLCGYLLRTVRETEERGSVLYLKLRLARRDRLSMSTDASTHVLYMPCSLVLCTSRSYQQSDCLSSQKMKPLLDTCGLRCVYPCMMMIPLRI
jgi:hypothetical protein